MVKVDKNKCIGCALCVTMCPETFAMDENNKSKVIDPKVTPCAKNAQQNCPVEAISL